MRDNYSWYSAAKSDPFWPNEKEPSKLKTFDLYIAQIPDGSSDCFVPPLIVFWLCIVPDTMFRMNQWSVKMIGLHSASKEKRAFQWHCFSLLKLIPQGRCFWVPFIHFSYTQQTWNPSTFQKLYFIQELQINWQSLILIQGFVTLHEKQREMWGMSNMWWVLCYMSVGEQ